MTPEFARAARQLLATAEGEPASATAVSERAVEACAALSKHLSRLLGDAGVDTMFRRAIAVASADIPWLAGVSAAVPGQGAFTRLREVLDQQDAGTAAEGFVAILWTFVGLLKRLIGEGLVDRLLNEVWPAVFSAAPKETP